MSHRYSTRIFHFTYMHLFYLHIYSTITKCQISHFSLSISIYPSTISPIISKYQISPAPFLPPSLNFSHSLLLPTSLFHPSSCEHFPSTSATARPSETSDALSPQHYARCISVDRHSKASSPVIRAPVECVTDNTGCFLLLQSLRRTFCLVTALGV